MRKIIDRFSLPSRALYALVLTALLSGCEAPGSMAAGHVSRSSLAVLIGSSLLLVLALGSGFYLIHRIFKEQRSEPDFGGKSPRVDNEATFALATMQGVITKMKAQEKELNDLRRAAEQRARESARLSENIIREMPSGLMVFNRDGFITSANPAVRMMLGIDTWSRRRYPEILGPQSTLTAQIRDCLATGKMATRETIEYTTPAGEARFLGMSLSPFHSGAGEVEGAVCLLSDLTETRRLHEQVRLKEHLAALGAMSAGIAHEFKNSLATISGYAQMLRDAKLDGPEHDFAEKIIQESRALTRVVTDFLVVSKPLQLTTARVEPKEIILHAMEDLKHVDGFKGVAMNVEGTFAAIEGDEVLLRQAFSNLLRNSCEAQSAQPGGGSVKVKGETFREANREMVRILFCDSGTGIPEADQDKLFVPFFTTKPSGSGLGLALVQKIIVSHGGLVNLESSSPEGTTFSVVLPVQ